MTNRSARRAEEKRRKRLLGKSFRGRPEQQAILADQTAHAEQRLRLDHVAEAEEILRQVLAVDPGFAPALEMLSIIYLETGRRVDALAVANQGIANCAETALFEGIFRKAIAGVVIQPKDGEADAEMVAFVKSISPTLSRALSEAWSNTGPLARTACILIKLDPAFQPLKDILHHHEDDLCREIVSGQSLSEALAMPLLNSVMEVDVVADQGLEAILTLLRRCLLNITSSGDFEKIEDMAARGFFLRLCLLCLNNEYLFFETAEETKLLSVLLESIEGHRQISPGHLLAVAAYRPLRQLKCAEKLLSMKWPNGFDLLLKRHIEEPLEEIIIGESISGECVAGFKNIRDQYEENPYPRWIKAPTAFEAAATEPSAKVENLLVAGCGTGFHAISCARAFKDSKVLAIDISKSSLAYAIRKTRELGIDNIEYRFGDINDLSSIERSFDRIESVGVLHHMENPERGWRALVDILVPDGQMLIALYSEIARQYIVAAREHIAERNYSGTLEDIRRCRSDVFNSSVDSPLRKLAQDLDFYSVSNCRDLIFNTQEQCFTLERIGIAIEDMNLDFLGFENLGQETVSNYRRQFPEDAPMIDLASWSLYENNNRDTFREMYYLRLSKPMG